MVKRSAKEESRYPLMEEYDFKNDHLNPLLNMDLRPSTRIRVSATKHIARNMLWINNRSQKTDFFISMARHVIFIHFNFAPSQMCFLTNFSTALSREVVVPDVWQWTCALRHNRTPLRCW